VRAVRLRVGTTEERVQGIAPGGVELAELESLERQAVTERDRLGPLLGGRGGAVRAGLERAQLSRHRLEVGEAARRRVGADRSEPPVVGVVAGGMAAPGSWAKSSAT
jgi:hypothetical protein